MANPQSFILDGKRYKLDPTVPIGQIKWLVAKVHCGTSDSEIVDNFRERCAGKATSHELTDQVCRYALKCHRDNQKLYGYVMSGRGRRC